ncbi:hypothetical protein LCGC14_1185640 [marine sediment metagenome]|uniref:Uncharacterized protein n=1 Tax=marine sediment metagenome TaxID=412755 RepID=A0A0F9M8L9_9ZZZZ
MPTVINGEQVSQPEYRKNHYWQGRAIRAGMETSPDIQLFDGPMLDESVQVATTLDVGASMSTGVYHWPGCVHLRGKMSKEIPVYRILADMGPPSRPKYTMCKTCQPLITHFQRCRFWSGRAWVCIMVSVAVLGGPLAAVDDYKSLLKRSYVPPAAKRVRQWPKWGYRVAQRSSLARLVVDLLGCPSPSGCGLFCLLLCGIGLGFLLVFLPVLEWVLVGGWGLLLTIALYYGAYCLYMGPNDR